jgi:hypothetical protein
VTRYTPLVALTGLRSSVRSRTATKGTTFTVNLVL